MANWRATATEEQKQKFKEAVSKGKKKMRENLSEEEKEKHINQLKENYKKGKERQTEESKKKFSDKMSKILKERWKNEDYRKYMSESASAQMKKQWDSYTDEEKEIRRKDIINKAKEYRESLDEKGKQEYINKMYQGRINAAKKREQNGEIKRPCQYHKCILGAKADSKINLKRYNKFISYGLSIEKEFPIGNYLYDFKVGNTLIEINPYARHNSTRVPSVPGAKVKDMMYHYNKTKFAISNGYNIINVWDWIDEDEVKLLLKKKSSIKDAPILHWYNCKTKEHIIDNGFNKDDMISKGFVEIRDGGEFYLETN